MLSVLRSSHLKSVATYISIVSHRFIRLLMWMHLLSCFSINICPLWNFVVHWLSGCGYSFDRGVEMGQMSDYDIQSKLNVWAGSLNECQMLYARNKQIFLLVSVGLWVRKFPSENLRKFILMFPEILEIC